MTINDIHMRNILISKSDEKIDRWSADSGPNYSGFCSGSAVRPFFRDIFFLFYFFLFYCFLIPLFQIPLANARTVLVQFYTSTVRAFVRRRWSLREFIQSSLFHQNQHIFNTALPSSTPLQRHVNTTPCRRQRYSLLSPTLLPAVVNTTCRCHSARCRRQRNLT